VVNGIIPAQVLVGLNPRDLAPDELKAKRKQTTEEATLARRGDLYEITRNEILAANGIDPNKGTEFQCRKCKGTKTTHYALQTRSSDEPMTVFVCCLGCGNRWRTQ
jgi:transcription elongation factor S-II